MHVVVFITASSPEEAEKIGRALVEKKLAACANVIGNVRSVYWWEGRVEEAGEAMVVVKTRVDKLNELIAEAKNTHSYQVPEIIAVPIIHGLPEYLKWIDDSLGK